ncbi:glutathione S-transferase family protein [Chondromyces crocatus]|uniref:Glutathione S-transferase n=1 Tax=Chondromyces crocatus TaxID=52 RepID=A0A0K1ENG8_CHOCO|nr:glutathione S-transferase family protein [Chondromyces crocatus]AKT42182.1 glutathione S-transferase [Chondromyces crocatus]
MSIVFYFSPWSNAVRIQASLAELGTPHEVVTLDLKAGDQRKPEFLALNPNGRVPTLVIDGAPIFESVAIQIALGDRYGVEKGLWPAPGTADHLQALSWLVWNQVTLHGCTFRYMQSTGKFVPEGYQHQPALAEHFLKDALEQLRILDAHLAGREYIVGDRCTLVDIDVVAGLNFAIQVAQLDITPFPHLAAWQGRMMQRPALRSALGGG